MRLFRYVNKVLDHTSRKSVLTGATKTNIKDKAQSELAGVAPFPPVCNPRLPLPSSNRQKCWHSCWSLWRWFGNHDPLNTIKIEKFRIWEIGGLVRK